MKTINLLNLAVVFSIAVLASSCKDDDDNESTQNETAFKFTSTYPTTKSSAFQSGASGVTIESFQINVEEIEIEFDDEDPLFASDTVATDFELEGPFVVNLMDSGNTLQTTVVSSVELPEAAYDEIEFKFRESEDENSDMFEKSILIHGEIDSVPFVFWSDEEIEVDIEFEEFVFLDEASRSILTISFDLGALFNTNAGGVDLSSATDDNGNGIIEIYPDNPDDNDDLTESIWDRIEDIIEAFEEE